MKPDFVVYRSNEIHYFIHNKICFTVRISAARYSLHFN